MNTLNLSILGFPAVNNDLQVLIKDSAGATVRTARPFLDGTVRVPDMEPGAYEMAIVHPNVVLPVLRQPIRILPIGDTSVSVLIDPSKFRNTPIADIPDANLGPVRDRTQSIGETMLPLTRKLPGEAITAADWNAMASAIRDLSQTTGELTRLVTPTGHDHPEITAKIEEMVTNFSELLTSLGAAMTELQRQIQALRFRRQVIDVLENPDLGGIDEPTRLAFTNVLDQLDAGVTDPPVRFGRTARTAGVQLGTQLDQLVAQQAGNQAFVDSAQVKNLQQSIDLLKGMRATTYAGEIEQLRNVDRQLGTGGLSGAVGQVR
jgi:hypothetical protein